MHDIAFIRQYPKVFDAGLAKRGADPVAAHIIELDARRREALTALQQAQNRRNEASKLIGQAMARGEKDAAEALKAEVAAIKEAIPIHEETERTVGAELDDLLARLPNLPADDVPEGADESGNVEIARWGTPRQFDFTPQEHADLAPPLGMDFETGAAIAGARFTFLRGGMARLHRALGQYMLDKQTGEAGYTECNPPALVREQTLFGTGQLPKFADDLYPVQTPFSELKQRVHTSRELMDEMGRNNEFSGRQNDRLGAFLQNQISLGRDMSGLKEIFDVYNSYFVDMNAKFIGFRDFFVKAEEELADYDKRRQAYNHFLIPTAEVSLTNSVREQILDEAQLPMRLTALTPCFRSEAGSAGRDTRGFIRQHQFEKVELVSIVRPEDSEAEHERMTQAAEAILGALELPYRKMLLCAGDMGAGARKTYDLEVWLPGQGAYREISSCSNTGDWQARRMNARYRPANETGSSEKKTRFVHTLNGSGLAVGRTLVAVLENYQQADGTVTVPPVLAPYMGGVERLTPE